LYWPEARQPYASKIAAFQPSQRSVSLNTPLSRAPLIIGAANIRSHLSPQKLPRRSQQRPNLAPVRDYFGRVEAMLEGIPVTLRAHLEPYYSDVGRPSIDPELMIRMLLVGYCYGRVINRFGRSSDETDRSRGRLTTLNNEIILVFRKSTQATDLVYGADAPRTVTAGPREQQWP
jgi:hypothetical protein